MKRSAVANANLDRMNSEDPSPSFGHEELDDVILGQLGEELDDVILDKLENCEMFADGNREEQTGGAPDTKELPTIISPEPAHEDSVLNQQPRRALTPNELPSLRTDITSATSETYPISLTGDSAMVFLTPCTTRGTDAETGTEEHIIRPRTSTICSTTSMSRLSVSERVSADTRRTSVSAAMPSQEPAPEMASHKEPITVTPVPAQPVTQTGRKTKRRRRDNYRKKAIKILRPIWNKFKQLVEDVLLDDKSLASRKSTMK